MVASGLCNRLLVFFSNGDTVVKREELGYIFTVANKLTLVRDVRGRRSLPFSRCSEVHPALLHNLTQTFISNRLYDFSGAMSRPLGVLQTMADFLAVVTRQQRERERECVCVCVCVGPRRPWPRPSGSSRYCAGRRFSLISFKIRIIRTRSANPHIMYTHQKPHIFH